MARTIKELDIGTPIFINEKGVPKEYVLLKKDDEGCIVLRANAIKRQRMNADNVAKYQGSEMDDYLCDEDTGFLSLFDDQTSAAIIARGRPTYEEGDDECHYISRRAFLLTFGELCAESSTPTEPVSPLVAALMIWKGMNNPYTAREATDDEGHPVYWWLSSPYSATYFCSVNSNGASNDGYASSAVSWARPALNVSAETIVSDEGADKIFLLPSESLKFLNIGKNLVRGLAEGITDERGAAVKAAEDQAKEITDAVMTELLKIARGFIQYMENYYNEE